MNEPFPSINSISPSPSGSLSNCAQNSEDGSPEFCSASPTVEIAPFPRTISTKSICRTHDKPKRIAIKKNGSDYPLTLPHAIILQGSTNVMISNLIKDEELVVVDKVTGNLKETFKDHIPKNERTRPPGARALANGFSDSWFIVGLTGTGILREFDNKKNMKYEVQKLGRISSIATYDDRIYAADVIGRVIVLSTDGQVISEFKQISVGGASRAIGVLYGMNFSKTGDLWLSDYYGNALIRIPSSELTDKAPTLPSAEIIELENDFGNPGYGLAFDSGGDVYIGMYKGGKIKRYSIGSGTAPKTTKLTLVETIESEIGQEPRHMAFDGCDFYLVDGQKDFIFVPESKAP